MLSEIAPYVRSADLAICHVETPMTPRPPQGYPVFNTPTQLARAIKQTGWRICDTASNHSVDQGQYGIDQTGLALDRAGVLHTGSFPFPGAQRKPLIVNVKGIKVAFLAYTEMTNGIPLPHPWSVNIASADAVRSAARAGAARGAQVVIVNFHWGRSSSRSRARFSSASPARLRRTPTSPRSSASTSTSCNRSLASAASLSSSAKASCSQTSRAPAVRCRPRMGCSCSCTSSSPISGARVASIGYMPTWDRHPDYTVLPIGDALRRHQAPADVLRASYDRTTAIVGRIPHVVEPIPARLP